MGSAGSTAAPVSHGNGTLGHETFVSSSSSGRLYQSSLQISENISQGSRYRVYAVAADLNRPAPNRMQQLCATPDGQPGLECIPADPPCVKSLDVACECIGLQQAQVTVQVGKTGSRSTSEAFHTHYIVLEAVLPDDGSPFNSSGFPAPTFEQLRQGNVNATSPSAIVAAAGSLCVQGNVATTFSVPDSLAGNGLRPNRNYIVCVAPPPVNGLTCSAYASSDGMPMPECVPFSTYNETVPATCSLSGCECDGSSDCNTQLTCNVEDGGRALVKYRVAPSSCGGLSSLTCSQLLGIADDDCCPAMDSPLTQVLQCCPTLAEGELDIVGSSSIDIVGMPSCGDIDVIAFAARTHCHRCPAPAFCSGQTYAQRESARQRGCASSPLGWQPDASGVCAAVPPSAPRAAPDALACSEASVFEDVSCATDRCAPGLCDVTVCEPRSNGTCSALPGADNAVYAIGDSPGTVCCMALPHTARVPPAYDILEDLRPPSEVSVGYGCAEFTSARQWQQVDFPQIDSSALYMVRPQTYSYDEEQSSMFSILQHSTLMCRNIGIVCRHTVRRTIQQATRCSTSLRSSCRHPASSIRTASPGRAARQAKSSHHCHSP